MINYAYEILKLNAVKAFCKFLGQAIVPTRVNIWHSSLQCASDPKVQRQVILNWIGPHC